MRKSKIEPERRARYKEIARRIIGADRAARRDGNSQNTIGEIERALVSAYREGREAGINPPTDRSTNEPTWLQIPPRSRDTLTDMSFGLSKRFGSMGNETSRIECFDQDGKRRWRLIDSTGRRSDKSVADGSVRPLLELNLLRPSNADVGIHELTEEGLHLCKKYWERSDRDDPTLPKQSLR